MVIVQNQKAHEHDLMKRGSKDILLTDSKFFFLMDGTPFHCTLLWMKYD